MDIIKWYLDKATEHIPGRIEKKRVREEMEAHLLEHTEELMDRGLSEQAACKEAVDAMGSNVEELAQQLALLHSYDSQKGYLSWVTILWIGMLLLVFQVGSTNLAVIEKAIGQAFVLAALFRLQTADEGLKKAFRAECMIFITRILAFASQAIPSDNAATVANALFSFLKCIEIMWISKIFYHCFSEWLADDKEGQILLRNFLLLIFFSEGIGAISSIIMFFTNEREVTIQINSPIVLWIAPVIIVGMIAFIRWGWKLKRKLQLLEEIGIKPVLWKQARVWSLAGAVLCLIPFAASAAVSLRPVSSASAYREIENKEDHEREEAKKQILSCSLEANNGNSLEEAAETFKDDVRELLDLLTKEELQLLAKAERIWFSGNTLKDQLGEVIAFLAEYPKDNPEQKQYRSGCMITMKAPYEGYTAASGYFAAGPDAVPTQWDNTESLLLYEEDGIWYQYQPEREEMNQGMHVVNYSFKRGSQKTCFYQAFSLTGNGEEEISYAICQHSIQHNMINIPYISFELQGNGVSNRSAANLLWNSGRQGNQFIPGTALNIDGNVWKERGILLKLKK